MDFILIILIIINISLNIFIFTKILNNKKNESVDLINIEDKIRKNIEDLSYTVNSKSSEIISSTVLEISKLQINSSKDIMQIINDGQLAQRDIVEKMLTQNNQSSNNLKIELSNIINERLKEISSLIEKEFLKTDELRKEILDSLNKVLVENKNSQIKLSETITTSLSSIDESVNRKLTEEQKELSQLIEKWIEKTTISQEELKKTLISLLTENLNDVNDTLHNIKLENKDSQLKLATSLKESLLEIRQMNESKLNEINQSVSDKLDKSLNDRLDSNFKQIGERLGSLYESLGELNKLSSGVTDLNKTLSNVKSRGIWGEIQLQGILEDTLTSSQYETNIPTKKNSSERVEFAIKIPSKSDDSEFIYLPIDSKFPSDIYGKIVAASEAGNAEQLITATKELEQRIKSEARTIRDKYIDPPNTTDFAIMFLPTESLYSEVLRIPGLYEWCQSNCKIIISGPTTISALLNSLRVGFSNLTLNKKTQEVIKTLQAVKTQYSTLDELIEKTQKKLSEAVTSTDKLKDRTRLIQNKMSKIDILEKSEADKILQIETSDS